MKKLDPKLANVYREVFVKEQALPPGIRIHFFVNSASLTSHIFNEILNETSDIYMYDEFGIINQGVKCFFFIWLKNRSKILTWGKGPLGVVEFFPANNNIIAIVKTFNNYLVKRLTSSWPQFRLETLSIWLARWPPGTSLHGMNGVRQLTMFLLTTPGVCVSQKNLQRYWEIIREAKITTFSKTGHAPHDVLLCNTF